MFKKDRSRDPKRVPKLGISDPISHVRTQSPAETKAQVVASGNGSREQMNEETTHNLISIKNGNYAKGGAKHREFLNDNDRKR